MPICGLNFDTLPTCDSHYYYAVTHLSLLRYSNTEYAKNKSIFRSKHIHSQNSLTPISSLIHQANIKYVEVDAEEGTLVGSGSRKGRELGVENGWQC